MITQPVSRTRTRRGFNLIELLIALAITASLLTATMVAIHASFQAYQTTTEVASTQAMTRLVVHRILTLIRTGQDFAPYPANPQIDTVIESNWMEFLTVDGDILRLEWIPATGVLWLRRDVGADNIAGVWDGEWHLLEGMILQDEPPNDPPNQAADTNNYHEPFALEWEDGKARLLRATLDISVVPDDNMSVDLDGDRQEVLRYVATALPRYSAYETD